VSDARLWHPWLHINRLLRVMLHTRWSAEAWLVVRVGFRRALALAEYPPLAVTGRVARASDLEGLGVPAPGAAQRRVVELADTIAASRAKIEVESPVCVVMVRIPEASSK
jgi:hypothetical protein